MARSYSEQFLLSLNSLNQKKLGVQFGMICVRANLPPSVIAGVVGVSRMTVHSWFRGKAIREKNADKIEKLMDIFEADLEQGTLPVSSVEAAKKYVGQLVVDN